MFYTILYRPINRLLEENPNLQNTFPSFRGVELQDLLNSRSLFLHAERVMAAVRKVVTTLEESNLTISCLHDLGKRHILWGISRSHFDVSINYVEIGRASCRERV